MMAMATMVMATMAVMAMTAIETNLKGDLGGEGIASIVWATVTIGASSFSSSATSTTSSETAAGACQNNFLLAKTVNFVNYVNIVTSIIDPFRPSLC